MAWIAKTVIVSLGVCLLTISGWAAKTAHERNRYEQLWRQDESVIQSIDAFAESCKEPGLSVAALDVNGQPIAMVCVQDPTKH